MLRLAVRGRSRPSPAITRSQLEPRPAHGRRHPHPQYQHQPHQHHSSRGYLTVTTPRNAQVAAESPTTGTTGTTTGTAAATAQTASKKPIFDDGFQREHEWKRTLLAVDGRTPLTGIQRFVLSGRACGEVRWLGVV